MMKQTHPTREWIADTNNDKSKDKKLFPNHFHIDDSTNADNDSS